MPARTATGIAALAFSIIVCGCPGGQKGQSGQGGTRDGRDGRDGKTLTIIGLAELRGQIEPCGCTTDPLGDISRTAQLVHDARAAGPTIVLDAGSALYTRTPVPAYLQAQEKLKSDLIVSTYKEELEVAAIGLGPSDLGMGAAAVRPPRQVANLAPDAGVATEAPKIVDAGGIRVGVFGVTGADYAPGLSIGDPAAAARQALTALRAQKPDVVVALMTMGKKDAVKLLKGLATSGGGPDVALLGLGRETPEPTDVDARAERIEGTVLVIPGNRGQVVSKLDLTLRPGDGPLVDAIGPAAAEAYGAVLDARLADLQKELDAFAKDPTADPAFVAQKQQEAKDLAAQREQLRTQPLQAPKTGSYFTLAQVRINKKLACDAAVQTAKVEYRKAAGAANVAAAANVKPAPPAPGKPGYVGAEACADCHGDEVAFWQKTKHAQAWETLEASSKQFDYECTVCHVTGWEQPGGSNMGFNEELRDVQCEVCHGPGSLHVDAEDDKTARATIRRAPPPELCAQACHTTEHSDTFQYEAYLRDIVGPGHGEERRKALGDGPTGHELRAAGLEKAGREIGARCTK